MKIYALCSRQYGEEHLENLYLHREKAEEILKQMIIEWRYEDWYIEELIVKE